MKKDLTEDEELPQDEQPEQVTVDSLLYSFTPIWDVYHGYFILRGLNYTVFLTGKEKYTAFWSLGTKVGKYDTLAEAKSGCYTHFEERTGFIRT